MAGVKLLFFCLYNDAGRDLARNEEFSEIAVINIFFTVLKTKTQLFVGGGVLRGKFRDKSRNWHVNKQEGTSILIDLGANTLSLRDYRIKRNSHW